VSNDQTETTWEQDIGRNDSSHTGSAAAREYHDREARIDRDPEATEARRREEFGPSTWALTSSVGSSPWRWLSCSRAS